MRKHKTRRDALLSRDDIVLTLTEARAIIERQLSGAPEYVRGYQDGIAVAIECEQHVEHDAPAVHERGDFAAVRAFVKRRHPKLECPAEIVPH